jgi:hypothetical protein
VLLEVEQPAGGTWNLNSQEQSRDAWASAEELRNSLAVAMARKETLRRSLSRKPSNCPLCVSLAWLLAAFLSLPVIAWHALRFHSKPSEAPKGKIWLAAHAEWSNRTRHVLKLASELPRPVPLILLGRPKQPVSEIRSLLQRHLPEVDFDLLRPISFTAFVRALPELILESLKVAASSRHWGYTIRFGEAAAILYRLQLGCVEKSWWKRSGYAPEVVIYGHTGNADTSLLEREQQKRGTRTVHLLHGFSTGTAFAGISNLAIAKCRHDAEWHERHGGYADSIVLPASRPKPAPPKRRWALLTNYAHPMALPLEAGIRHEQQALRIVARAAREMGLSADQVLYRPHPGLQSLREDLQATVAETAAVSGLGRWPDDLSLDALRELELVITTPSTVIQDALLAGTVPVLLDLAEADESSVYCDYPLKARSEDELVAMLQDVQSNRTQAFDRAWEAVGPGINPRISAIVGVLEERSTR